MEQEIKICSNCKHIRTGFNPETFNEPGYYYPYCEIYGERDYFNATFMRRQKV